MPCKCSNNQKSVLWGSPTCTAHIVTQHERVQVQEREQEVSIPEAVILEEDIISLQDKQLIIVLLFDVLEVGVVKHQPAETLQPSQNPATQMVLCNQRKVRHHCQEL